MKLNILHISDFHYKYTGADIDFSMVAEKLLESVKDKKIDLVVFSGDLVYSGENEIDIKSAYDLLIVPLMDTLGLGLERLMIAPGNHDMQRGKELKSITKNLANIQDSASLREFISDERELVGSIENFEAFNCFMDKIVSSKEFINKLVRYRTINIYSKKIALIDINSSWRCKDSKYDRGNLLFPSDYLRNAFDIAKKENADFILCNMHHALSDFKEFIEDELQELIYTHCNILFTGHYHKQIAGTLEGSSIGLLHNRAAAVYNRHDKVSQYGYSIIEYDPDNYTAKIYSYIKSQESYLAKEPSVFTIPLPEAKYKLNEFRKKIRSLEKRLFEKADDLFVAGRKSYDGKAGFSCLFVEPVLKDTSLKDIIATRKRGEVVHLESLLNSEDDYIVYGPEKCGKTSLLWKLLLDTLHDFYIRKTIPYYIDAKDWSVNIPKPLIKQLAEYLSMNHRNTEDIFRNYKLLLLIDNYRVNDEQFQEWLYHELENFDNYRIIANANETLLSGYDISLRSDEGRTPIAKKVFIHEISRKQLHQLTLKWPNLSDEKRAEVERRLLQVFNQMHIPFNYWTASLFLWIFERTDEANIHNNFELVKLYVDELLGRNEIVKDRQLNLQYDDLLSFLGALAYELLQNPQDLYAMTYEHLMSFTNMYRDKKLKFTETTKNTLDRLIQTGTLYERSKDMYTFRLKGIWEFFLAYHMTENDEFRKQVINDLTQFLSYSNELELYAGFRPNDIEYVNRIFEKTQTIMSEVCHKPGFSDLDEKLTAKLFIQSGLAEAVKEITHHSDLLSETEENDEMLVFASPIDTGEIQLKKKYEEIESNASNTQRALFILARVYRNSRICDDPLGTPILDFVINGVSNLGFMVHEEFKEKLPEAKYAPIVNNLAAFMPLIIEAYLFDALVQHNLARVFENKLDELYKKPEGNQYRLFLLSLSLLDLDIDRYATKLDKLQSVLKNTSLRFALKLKCIFLYTHQERLSNRAKEVLRNYISLIETESNGKAESNLLLDKLEKKREVKLLSYKAITNSTDKN